MASFTINDLTFTYPQRNAPALRNLSFSIAEGQFVILCGVSGCGKTTLLRQLKPILAPHGTRSGEVLLAGKPLAALDRRTQCASIGFVMQNPDNQIVTDKVWHELAFGLESLGCDSSEIRRKVAEIASFFGIQNWFHHNVSELSGGQKQLLNLASAMVTQPSALILDEPTGQLDPIAAADFLATVGKINKELGVTVIMTEHRLEEVFSLADRVLVLEQGEIIADGTPHLIGTLLRDSAHPIFFAMPTPIRVHAAIENNLACPLTVREGRAWLTQIAASKPLNKDFSFFSASGQAGGTSPCVPFVSGSSLTVEKPAVEFSDVWFRYDRTLPDVLKGLSLKISWGSFHCLLGGNGTGKSTALSLLTGINKPTRGSIKIDGRTLSEYSGKTLFDHLLGTLPQDPQALFVGKTVREDLLEMLPARGLADEEKSSRINRVSRLCRLETLLDAHPYDLSGGEQQRAALAKILLLQPRILLLDEPTKGMDAGYKQIFAKLLQSLNRQGVTILMVSHDIEFCAEYAGCCSLFFDGGIASSAAPREFFSDNNFYTTAANRMARHILPEAITVCDIVAACGGTPAKKTESHGDGRALGIQEGTQGDGSSVFFGNTEEPSPCIPCAAAPAPRASPNPGKRTLAALLLLLLAIPLTIYAGVYLFGDRKYYFTSMLIILEAMLPFVMLFESRKPRAQELIVIAVLCAIAVAGRAAFFMFPQCKPVVALIIIAGLALGGETGFLVGAVTGFVSNFFFGQGPWTPWQMFALGLIGFLAGSLFPKGIAGKRPIALCVFGALCAFFIYGGIMNTSAVFTYQAYPTWQMFVLACLQGIPFDLLHAAATAVFLWILARPMLEKLDRIKTKYGLKDN